jgi:S-adenosylmethionine decarboxylase
VKGTEIRKDLFDVAHDILMDVEKMEQVCRSAAQKHGATVVASVSKVLGETTPPGFTLAVLLDQSSITVHTYADDGLLALNVFTCGKKAKPNLIAKDIVMYARGRVIFSDESPRFATPNPELW